MAVVLMICLLKIQFSMEMIDRRFVFVIVDILPRYPMRYAIVYASQVYALNCTQIINVYS